MMRLTREDFQHAISEARKNDDDYASIPFRFGIPNAKEALIAAFVFITIEQPKLIRNIRV